jgi:hypothetical protein
LLICRRALNILRFNAAAAVRSSYPCKNEAFVNKLVTTYGDKIQNQTVLTAVADAHTAYQAASAKIVRHEFKP